MHNCAQVFAALGLNGPSAVPGISKAQLVADVQAALYASKICSYAQVRGCIRRGKRWGRRSEIVHGATLARVEEAPKKWAGGEQQRGPGLRAR